MPLLVVVVLSLGVWCECGKTDFDTLIENIDLDAELDWEAEEELLLLPELERPRSTAAESALALRQSVDAQRQALESLFALFNGEEWSCDAHSWMSDNRSHCFWPGVWCSLGENVTSLTLSNCGLRGNLADTDSLFAALPLLSRLELKANKLVGTIPRSLSSSAFMTRLDLSENSLQGEIPGGPFPRLDRKNPEPQLLTLSFHHRSGLLLNSNKFTSVSPGLFLHSPALRLIRLQKNLISGPLPTTFAANTVLLGLYLFQNRFSGTLDSLETFSTPSPLLILHLFENNFCGTLPRINSDQFYRLRDILLSSNSLSGTISLGPLPTLQRLDLSQNQLSQQLQDTTLFDFPGVLVLVADGNKLTGPIDCSKVGDLHGLFLLSLRNNRLEGPLCSEFGQSLYDLFLNNNLFCGTLPSQLGGGTLQTIDLGNNGLCGTIPSQIASPWLVNVYLDNNLLRGRLPTVVIPGLGVLSVLQNQISGQLPSQLASSLYLEYLWLTGNPLGGTLPPQFSKLAALRQLLASDCDFSGTLPHEYGARLTDLELVDLSDNRLSGSLPPLWASPHLTQLYLAHNRLSASVTPEYRALFKLEVLDLAYNHLVGVLDDYLLPFVHRDEQCRRWIQERYDLVFGYCNSPVPNDCKQLQYLDLKHNQISGSLSESISALVGLSTLDISKNQLQGTLPTVLGLYTLLDCRNSTSQFRTPPMRLVSLDLSTNQRLSGPIPESFKDLQLLRVLDLSDTGLESATGLLPSFLTFATTMQRLLPLEVAVECPPIQGAERYLTVQINPSYYQFRACRCINGFFGEGDVCSPCPKWCLCRDGAVSHCWPDSQKQLQPCATVGGQTLCNPRLSPDFECGVGVEQGSILCSKCADNYFQSGRDCVPCPTKFIWLFPILLVLYLAFYLLLGLRKTGSEFQRQPATVRISVFHLQMLGVVGLPGALRATSRSGGEVSDFVGFRLPVPECFGATAWWSSFVIVNMAPVVFVFVIAGVYVWLRFDLGARIKHACGRDASGEQEAQHSPVAAPAHRCLACLVTLLDVWYFQAAQKTLGVLACTIKTADGAHLQLQPYVECAGPEYARVLATAILLFITVIVGYPVVLFTMLWRLHTTEKLEDGVFSVAFGFIYRNFKPSVYYWNFVIVARKLFIAMIIVSVPFHDTITQYCLVFVILQGSVVLTTLVRPYAFDWDNHLEHASLLVLTVSFVSGLIASGDTEQTSAVTIVGVFTILLNFAMLLCFLVVGLLDNAGKFMRKLEPIVQRRRSQTWRGEGARAALGVHVLTDKADGSADDVWHDVLEPSLELAQPASGELSKLDHEHAEVSPGVFLC